MLPIGGPGEAMTALQQGEMLFKILDKKPFFLRVRIGRRVSVDPVRLWLGGRNMQATEALLTSSSLQT